MQGDDARREAGRVVNVGGADCFGVGPAQLTGQEGARDDR